LPETWIYSSRMNTLPSQSSHPLPQPLQDVI
jgi:hypothetical protein